VLGESDLVRSGTGIRRLSLVPDAPRCVASALDAVRRAKIVVSGPGSLYTSILPPLLIPEMRDALRDANATRVFVLNLMTEPGETGGFNAIRHLEVLSEHLGYQPFDHVIFNTAAIPAHLASAYQARGSVPITITTSDVAAMREMGLQPLGAPLACEGPTGRIRHHPGRVAAAIVACDRFGRP
jgi:uncharacterized cofD-like protein